eukprot:2719189-Lingulodinium_polyedra.AAC.1
MPFSDNFEVVQYTAKSKKVYDVILANKPAVALPADDTSFMGSEGEIWARNRVAVLVSRVPCSDSPTRGSS